MVEEFAGGIETTDNPQPLQASLIAIECPIHPWAGPARHHVPAIQFCHKPAGAGCPQCDAAILAGGKGRFAASIATLPEEKEAKTTSMEDDPLDLDAIRPLVMEMIALSEAGSLQALTCLAKLQPLLKGSKACHELSKLEASLDRIDFIEAQSALKVIRDTLGV